MNDIIKVNYDSERPTASARELHEFLEVGTAFKDWFPRMCEYGFLENADYTPLIFEHPQNKQPCTDYQMTVDMAKEIAMLQRTEKGKEARTYFINLEKQWNSPEYVMARAIKMAEKKIIYLQSENLQQKQIIGELKPKANYVDAILNNHGLVTITQIAKDYGMSGTQMNNLLHQHHVQYKQSGQWLLYEPHQAKGYTHSNTIPIERRDGTKDVTMQTKWTQKGRLFIYELLKSDGTIPVIEQSDKSA